MYTYDDSPSAASSNDEEDYTLPSSHYKNARYEDNPDYDSAPSSFEQGLMARLLNVVENKLVEVNELELIRKELQVMKSELLQREDRRQSRLGEVKNMIINGISELRIKMMEDLAYKENSCRKELDEMRNSMMMDLVLKERVIRNMLEENTSHTNHILVQQQLQDTRVSFERKLEGMKVKLDGEINGMEKLVSNGVMKCETNIQDLLSELGAELNYQLEDVRSRFLALERVIRDDPRNRDSLDA
jgi:predicted DNA-binding protein